MPQRKAKDLTHSLVAGLQDMISSGALQPGSRLPPERVLAKQFGVNRASIRQALKALDVMGIVHQRVGDGTYLTQDASTTLRAPLDFLILVDGITFQELFEARRIVEPELAARAARRRSEKDIADLEKEVSALKAKPDMDAQDLAEHDLRFHEIIWRASGNRVCQRMFSSLHRAMSRSLRVTSSLRDEGTPITAHEQMFQAIREGDAERARVLMFEHLTQGEKTILKTVPEMVPA
ncbi:MAG TPA: FadR/GntR family transcriptional regulator [Bryobacteraceae bacterium]|jgi:GntR family transcriptional repressor for pyruvate dehydrogenase complex|nr:FadR/GntR family transcriptional regulator [Bryobacteraceae bacterium]